MAVFRWRNVGVFVEIFYVSLRHLCIAYMMLYVYGIVVVCMFFCGTRTFRCAVRSSHVLSYLRCDKGKVILEEFNC